MFTPNKALFLSSSFNSRPTIKHTATSLQILLSQPTTATRHTLKQFLLLYNKHKLPLALCHKDSFSPQSFTCLETSFPMKIGVKPSDLAYHVFNTSHPLTLYKEELLAGIVHFPKYSREAFLKDIAAHSNLKPVSGSDSFTLTPLPSTRNSDSSTLAQETFQFHNDQKAILENLTLDLQTKLGTKRWVFGGDSSAEGPTYDYSQISGIDNSESTGETSTFSEHTTKLALLQYAWTKLWAALLHKEYNGVDLELTDWLLEEYSLQAPTLIKKKNNKNNGSL
ncbi:uncharacterized protein EAE97_004393 [Botrytis byssoidea]|uniref:Uncharacterized protein n=1 Tax=Botrytis byssoidea TaxID=139641 RepID=A0A9P5IR67_9HELO|nr:uncharacterized protein EAE97_004393 [Botrytis byssoidea]KAF7947144.1 hypothetical protein EAE97_004393 [Botrytis byssoidea]